MDVSATIQEHLSVCSALQAFSRDIEHLARRMAASLREGGKICWMGNGGSAADSQHLAAEFVGRFELERGGLASVALTTDSSVLTAVGNDYGFEAVFERQVEALCRPPDVVIGISSSGNSENVCRALERARSLGCYTAALTGRTGGRMAEIAETSLIVPSTSTARIQEAHILIGHILCGEVERAASMVHADGAYAQ